MVVKERVAALTGAIEKFCDQNWAIRCRKSRAEPGRRLRLRVKGGDSLGQGRRNYPLPEIGTIDCYPSIDLAAVKQVSNSALRLSPQTEGDAAGNRLVHLQSGRNCSPRIC